MPYKGSSTIPYAPYAKVRQDGSNSILYAFDDTDLAGAIPDLPAGGGR
jgi:hypothetical protein